jgi:2'-5' RNA ligase
MSELFTGSFGIAVVPDLGTRNEAFSLAKDLMPQDSFIMGANGELPHMTLYHGKIENAPVDILREIRDSAQRCLTGASLTLSPIDVAGGKFVFWNLTEQSKNLPVIAEAHTLALKLSTYLRPGDAAKALKEEGLKLSNAEIENCNQYGHPWVGSLYRPHITLGFVEKGIDPIALKYMDHSHRMNVDRVILFEVGYPGIVKREIDPGRIVPKPVNLNP